MAGGVQPWITGPNFIFVGGSPPVQGSMLSGGGSEGSTPQYLGTAVVCPKPEIERAWRPILSSYRGLGQQSEQAFYGEEAHIFMVLSRWDADVFDQQIAVAIGASSANSGSVAGTEIGQLLQAQGIGVQLSILFPYQSQSAYSGQPAGYRYLCTMPKRYLPLEDGGYDGNLMGIHFHATSVYDGSNWVLFDDEVPAVPTTM